MDESTNCLRNSPTLGQKRKSSTDSDDATDVKKQPLQPQIDDKKNINNLRKNIRDVLDENQLDSTTLAAQREESERLARVNEQQKIIREYQRQTAVNRQVARTQSRVLSLLQNSSTFAKVTDYSASYSPPAESCEPTVSSNVIESSSSNNTTNSEDPQSNFCEVPKEKIQTASEIVTIDDSSDDDCILLSDEEEIEDETEEEDANNSGMHVKDVYNVPDEMGRVIINIGHPEGEDDIFVAPQIAKTIKPHQIGGIRFLFDNIIESTKRFKSSSGFGCILAHSMGLGKTLQVVCFCDIFMRHTPSNSILCVMPINTIQNWLCEFNMWTPRVSNDTENVRPRTFEVFALNDQQKTLSARGKVILRWAKEGGVLLMGYELFRLLALKLTPTRRRRGKGASKTDIGPKDQANNNLMDEMYKALVKPGPDLVICDEGHRIKNAHAGISVALKQIRTRRRIVLTGYPLQNNLLEYWCMVDFVRPNYLGTRSEFCNMFERPIQNGQCIDSTPEDTKLMRYRAHVLHSLLMGFVQRRSHTVLQQTLPEKQEYVILTRMTSFQKQLYDTFMNDVVRTKSCPNPLKAFAVCCKIWNHPDVLYNFLKKRQADLDLEIDEVPSEEQTVQVEILNNDEANAMKSKLPNTSNTDVNSNGNEKTIQKNMPAQPTSNYEKNVQSQRSEFYGDNYFQQFSTNINGYWQDSNTQYDNDCPPMSYSSEPNYVGMVKQNFCKKIEEISPNQSEIVDLDTKEIKTVSTNMNMRRNSFNDSDDQSKKLSPTSPNEEKNEKGNTLPVVKPKSEDLNDTTKIKSDEGIPYDWATELMKNYQPGLISNSPKMEIVFYILKESIEMGDRILLFSQSLLTLNLIESFLEKNYIPNTNCFWSKNTSYCRLDGSTSAQEREKLVNEFNSNTRIKLFLISTRAGSLGINLIGANRVIIFDASWNPCHDTQAVYRVYRYGQFKSCYIYRIVMDKCLEKKIYDRQIKKQGMSNRVVDECNPESHLSLKEVTNLCHDYENEKEDAELFVQSSNVHTDVVIQKIVEQFKNLLSKEPFHHESLLVDRKEKKLSQAEKRLAHRGYEIEKKSISQKSTFSNGKMQYRIMNSDGSFQSKPLSTAVKTKNAPRTTRWIPADVWQRQGMTAQEMTLPLDVVIPTNSSDKSSIILKAGQRVMVLKSTKGIYMQLESGKIIAIRTSNKSTETVNNTSNKSEVIDITSDADNTTDSKKNPTKADNITRTDYKQSSNTVQRTKSEDMLQNLDKSSSQNIKNTNDVLENDKLATKPFLKDNTQNHLPPATPNALQKDQKETFWEPQSKFPESPKEQNSTWKNSSKYQDEQNSAYDYLSTSTYKSAGADENKIKNMNNESLKSVSSLDRIQEHEKNPKDVLKKHDLYLSAPNKLECGNNGIRNFVDFNIDQQKDKKSNIADYSLNEEKPNAKSEEVKQHSDLDTIPTRNFPLPMNASYSHIDTLKNIDYSSFQQQPHQSLFKPTLYPPQFNSQRYPFSGMASSSQNSASILNSNSSNNINAYMPSRDINNYSTQYYDGYTTNSITDPCNYPLRYADYSSYGSYNHSLYQNNLSQQAYRSNANSSLKPYHMPWPELVTHSPSTENCSTTYPSSNYSNGSHTNHWPN